MLCGPWEVGTVIERQWKSGPRKLAGICECPLGWGSQRCQKHTAYRPRRSSHKVPAFYLMLRAQKTNGMSLTRAIFFGGGLLKLPTP